MAGAGKKTFTAGEVLTASDVNTYLMEQSVMVFGGTAARSSAIPTPSTGMTSYIGVTGTASIPQIETYTGSAWQTPYGLTLLGTLSFTSQSSVSFNNVFSANYDSYRVVGNFNTPSTNLFTRFRLRAAGTDNTTSAYQGTKISVTTLGAVAAYGDAGATSTGLFDCEAAGNNGANYSISVDIHTPFLATRTTASMINTGISSDFKSFIGGMIHSVDASYDGFTMFTNTGSISGTMRVYGYRKS
jgi:hypothetical protein